MSEKPGKHKKGFMSRLSSFRKKKSSSKGSSAGLQSGKKAKKEEEESASPASSATNSLEGLHSRTQLTSDLIEKFEERLSGQQVDQENPQPSLSETRIPEGVEGDSTFTVDSSKADKHAESDTDVSASKPLGKNVNSSKQTPSMKPTPTNFRGGMRPYQSVFSDDDCSQLGDSAMSGIQGNADNTTQTEFSATSDDADDHVARLVKVRSEKTPEMRRAQLSVTANYGASVSTCSNNGRAGGSNSQSYKPKETLIGPEARSPIKATIRSQSKFQSTSTPMPRAQSCKEVLKSSQSPIDSAGDNSTSSISWSRNIGEPALGKEMSISRVQSSAVNDKKASDTISTTSSVSPTKLTSIFTRDVWERQSASDSEKSKMGLTSLESKMEMNSTYVKAPEPKRTISTTASPQRTESPSAVSGANRTVVLERAAKTPATKASADRTFSLDSAGADSLGSDDLMCDSRFASMDESLLGESQSSYHKTPTRPTSIIGRDRTRSFDHLRKESEDSVSSSLPSMTSMMSSLSGRSRLNSVDKDSMVIVEASMYNSMVRDLAAMRLALLKLNTTLVDAGVLMKKTRTSGVQCEMMWDKSSVETQTGVSEPVGPSTVSAASIQCSLHPPRVSCGIQYEKQELPKPKPSKLAAPSSAKLVKPRTSQAKENGAAEESGQVSDSTEDNGPEQRPLFSPTDAETEGFVSPQEEKQDEMKNGNVGRSVEIQVKDAGVTGVGQSSMDDGESDGYCKGEIYHLDNASQNGLSSCIEERRQESSPPTGGGDQVDALRDTEVIEVLTGAEVNDPSEGQVKGPGPVQFTGGSGDITHPGATVCIPNVSNDEKKSAEMSKASKLQGNKSTNLRYSKNIKPAAGVSSKLVRPQGGLRPPHGRVEVTSKMSTTKIIEQKTLLQPSISQRKVGVGGTASGLKPPSTPNVAVVRPTVKEVKGQTGSGANRQPPKNQGSRPQQRTTPQSKMVRPASYTSIPHKNVLVEPTKRASLPVSGERIVDDNGNTSTVSLPENSSKESGIRASAAKSGNTRLPKAKSTSRLPRGGGIPKMTRR